MNDVDTPGLKASVEAAVENAKTMTGPDLVLFRKLFTLQCAMGKIAKTAKNDHTHSTYFNINGLLDVLMPLMVERQLLLMQPLEESDQGFNLLTMIMDTESGATLSYKIRFPANSDPQRVGSSLTYFRRYCLQSLLSIVAEDDDGNQNSGGGSSSQGGNRKPPPKPATQKQIQKPPEKQAAQAGASEPAPVKNSAERIEAEKMFKELMEFRAPAVSVGVDETTFWVTVTTNNNISYDDMHKAWRRIGQDLDQKTEKRLSRLIEWKKKAKAEFGPEATGEPAKPEPDLPF